MDPRFFSILGLDPTRDRQRSGLNDAQSHREDASWQLGAIPDTLVAAYRRARVGRESSGVARYGPQAADPSPSAS